VAELYALDANVYIRALRDSDRLSLLKRFLIRSGMRVRVNAVVALELQAGARTPSQERAVSDLVESYVARNRVILLVIILFLTLLGIALVFWKR
jgi:predicted nucleic acid-binding protein